MAGGVAKILSKIKKHVRKEPKASGPSCIDLFSGAGGLAEGFRQAGWGILSGADVDPDAGETFRLNFPEATFFEGPISGLDGATLLADADLSRGELGCLIGGPPCQSFSYNNHQRSASDERARLFRSYLEIVEALLPKSLVMENVPGMLTIGDGRIVSEIERRLGKLGYEVAVRILFAEDYGVPQARRRAFVVASRVGSPDSCFPTGTHGPSEKPSKESNPHVHRWEAPEGASPMACVTVGDALSDLRVLRSGGGRSKQTYRCDAESDFQRQMRGQTKLVRNHVCHKLTDDMLERIAHVPEGGNWRDIPRPLLPAGMRRARKSDHTKRYGRLSRKGLASTILTKCDPHWGAYIHPTQNRTISVREAARLQGFPDRFRFAGTHTSKQYTQVGNAVPVPLARAVAVSVLAHVAAADSPKAEEGGKQGRPLSATG
jgi:DNA (cytosine-5)-methyltransferase 1